MSSAYQHTLPMPFLFEFWWVSEFNKTIYPARKGRALLRLIGENDLMPTANRFNRNAFQQVEFVTINLDTAAEKAFRIYAKDNLDKLVPMIAEFMAEPHKLGLSWDDSNNCFIASATCKNEKSENHNQCITARSDDWSEALLLLLFKHYVVAKGGTWSDVSRPIAWG